MSFCYIQCVLSLSEVRCYNAWSQILVFWKRLWQAEVAKYVVLPQQGLVFGAGHLRGPSLLSVFKHYTKNNMIDEGGGGVGWDDSVICYTFSCTCTHTSCYAAVRSHALAHICHATQLFVLMHLRTYVMLRCCTFSCTCTHTSCYAAVSSHALACTDTCDGDDDGDDDYDDDDDVMMMMMMVMKMRLMLKFRFSAFCGPPCKMFEKWQQRGPPQMPGTLFLKVLGFDVTTFDQHHVHTISGHSNSSLFWKSFVFKTSCSVHLCGDSMAVEHAATNTWCFCPTPPNPTHKHVKKWVKTKQWYKTRRPSMRRWPTTIQR